ncbi:MAG: arginase family protein [Chloroflexia bacterium]|nr:arginase family protein [Chloroflexia bacterium]
MGDAQGAVSPGKGGSALASAPRADDERRGHEGLRAERRGEGEDMRVRVVTVPYRYDEPDEGLGKGPTALLEAGLLDRLRERGVDASGASSAALAEEDRVAGPVAANIGRLGATTATLVAAARAEAAGVLVLAGDDTASVGIVSGLQQAHGAGARIGIVWLDAHGDFNTPETSYSGILAGMPLAILAGLAGPVWRTSAGLAAPVPTDRILIAGVRELDEREETLLRSTNVQVVAASAVAEERPFAQALHTLLLRSDILFLHVDLDVLDPSLVPSASTPSPDGWSVEEAAAVMRTVLDTGKVVVVGIAGLNPGAGQRGERSIETTIALIEAALPAWQGTAPDAALSGA